MTRRILDSQTLIGWWRKKARQSTPTEKEVRLWAQELIHVRGTDLIVTPVYLEVLVGTTSSHELRLHKCFLAEFRNLDNRNISSDDWRNAQKYAERVPRDGKKRQLGDCLVRALADRFRCSVDTGDKRFPKKV
jgi:hypothetical protein